MTKADLELLRQKIAAHLTSDGDFVEVAKVLMKDQDGKDAHKHGCNR